MLNTPLIYQRALTLEQGNWEYTASKYALRGFMRTARRNSWEQAIRIAYVAPCWIKSAIRTAEYEKWLVDRGIDFGEQIDVSSCMMRIATDRSINGKFPYYITYLPIWCESVNIVIDGLN